MSAIKGDFISFTYNGVHSTELGIVRVTASNRYTDLLLPTIQDKTVPVPGNNGTYFFGTYYPARNITINIAYNSVTEAQLREMRRVFSADAPHELIFDDEPYKVYYAKITGTPQLQYIPFDSEDAIYSRRYINNLYTQTYYERVYKGEGTLTFTCFDPFAHCLNESKYLDLYVCIRFNKDEFELGNLKSDTGESYNTNKEYRIKLKNFYPLEGTIGENITFTLNTNFNYYYVYFYESNEDFISSTGWKDVKTSFTTPTGAAFIKIVLANDTSVTSGTTPKITVDNFSYAYLKRPNWYNPSWIQRPYSKQYKIGEWNLSAHLLNSKSGYDNDSNTNNNIFTLYNPGDVETDFLLFVPYGELSKINSINVTNSNTLYINGELDISSKFTPLENNEVRCICFNSKMNLIEEAIESGVNTGIYRKTGVIFNEIIESGSWPKIPQTGYKWVEDGNNSGWEPKKNILFKINVTEGLSSRPTLRYDYLYY